MNVREMKAKRADLISQARAMIDAADGEQRGLTADETARYDALVAEVDALAIDIERRERLEQAEREMARTEERQAAPPVMLNLKTHLGDSEERAFCHYLRTGDMSRELRASNDTDMNVGTPADGGYAVPVGLFNGIIARRNELMLAPVLGVRNIPGQGTTVNVPVDSGSANVFVSTLEAQPFDRDAPALNQKPMTLVKYTKRIQMSYELLQDEDARIMDFLADYVGRALALTHNSLLIAEVLANGTANTLAAAAAATATDIPTLVYKLKGEYADGAQWVMQRATEGAYRALTGNNFQFVNTPSGPENRLWGFPVNNSEFVEPIATGKKSLVFGNFSYVGMRESPSLTMLRDPYSSAANGQVNLFYYFRCVYKVLQAEAIQYGVHP